MHVFFDGFNTPNSLIKKLNNWGFTGSNKTTENAIYYPTGKGSLKRLNNAISTKRHAYFAQISGTEFLTSKQWLWHSMMLKYNKEEVLKILPETYLLHTKIDKERLVNIKSNYPNDSFILKGNKQKRKTIKIIKGKQISEHINSSNYVVAQRIIETSKTFTDRPFHFRLYLIISIEGNEIRAHVYNNGKIIYGHKGEIITYNIIAVMRDEPSFFSDIKSSKLRYKIQEQIFKKLQITIKSIIHRIKNKLPTHSCVFHQLMGIDAIIDPRNQLKLIEINLSPEMKGTSERDIELKSKVQQSYFKLFKGNRLNSSWTELVI